MGFLAVFVAGLGAFAFGAVWYMTLAKPWMAVSGVEIGDDGKPANEKDPIPYIVGVVSCIVVAGMMRHTFASSGIDTLGAGLLAGLGVGLFLATPWLATCYGFAGRPRKLLLIDGGYATGGCTVIGAILPLIG